MYAAAQEHEEVLVKHGASGSVLARLGQIVAEFDAVVMQGAGGRTAHTAATRELAALTKEAGAVVRAMDARNRLRYQDDRQALEQWVSVRTVLGSPTGGSKDAGDAGTGWADGAGGADGKRDAGAGGDVRPAA